MPMVQQNDFWRGKRVFGTGLTGFIGTHLSRKLKELEADLVVMEHVRKAIPGVKTLGGDIAHLDETFEKELKDFNPEVVFHLAAQPLVSVAAKDVCETVDTNVKGVCDFLCICKDIQSLKSLVFVSTDKVYGNISQITKDTIPQGVEHPYNASKLAADALAQMYSNFFDIPTVVVRNANVYGAGDEHYDRIIPRTIQNIHLGLQPVIRGGGKTTRDYIHVSEIVNGYLSAAEIPMRPFQQKLTTINLNGFNHSVVQIVDTLLEKMGRVDLAPAFEPMWKGEIPNQHIINDKAKELIGWNPQIDISLGLSMTIPWYLEKFANG